MSETPALQPAMTPEQWIALANGEEVHDSETSYSVQHGDIAVLDISGRVSEIDADDRHMAAAICLHNQPFGFAWKDVWELESITSVIRACEGGDAVTVGDALTLRDAASLERVAKQIRALLPPPPQESHT